MATQAQIEANRRNAQKSTGPRTAEGKITAGQNALRHGLCSKFALMEEEEDEEAQALLQALTRRAPTRRRHRRDPRLQNGATLFRAEARRRTNERAPHDAL